MRLAEYTDYALRVLMYCAAHPDRLVTIAELAERHGVSKNHLMKIVNHLGHQGLLRTTRGRGGGVALLREPSEIRVGEVVRTSESDLRMVECFDATTNTCLLTPTCRLKRVFDSALRAYLNELDKTTLADIAFPPAAPGRAADGSVRLGATGGALPLESSAATRPAPKPRATRARPSRAER